MSIIHYNSLTFQTGTAPNKSNAGSIFGLPDTWPIQLSYRSIEGTVPLTLQPNKAYNELRSPLYSNPKDFQRLPNYSYTQSSLIVFPNNQFDWPLPKGNPRPDEFYSWNFTQGVIQKPFHQDYWPLTPAPKPIDQFWEQEYLPLLVGQDRQFQGPGQWQTYDYPNPPRVNWYQSWTVNLLQSTLAPVILNPFNQYYWPLPKVNPRPDETYVYSLNILQITNPNPQPFAQSDWPNPYPIKWYEDWYNNLQESTLAPVIINPFVQSDWPIPRANPRLDQWWFNEQPFATIQTPFVQSDWPNSPRVVWYQDHNNNLTRFFVPVPFSQTDWPNPRTWVPIDQFWKDNPELLLQFVNLQPFVQSDWPLTKAPQSIDPTWLQSIINLFPPPPLPPAPTSSGKTWTKEEWTQQLEKYVQQRQPPIIPELSAHFSKLGKLSGIARNAQPFKKK